MKKQENNRLNLEKIFEKNGINIKTLAQVLENSEINSIVQIPLNDLIPNRFQPRIKFDETKLKEMADSIVKHGVITPIIVRQIQEGQYEIVTGERRYRASKLANKETIPAIIAEFNDKQMMELSLIENIQRENLTGIEEARSYEAMKQHLGYTQAQIAKEMGKPRSHVANLLRLLTLPEMVQQSILDEKISTGHAKLLVGLDDKEAVNLTNRIIRENLSVRDVEHILLLNQPNKKNKPVNNKTDVTKYNQLEEKLQTKLNHKQIRVDKKRIQIKFDNEEELVEFIERIQIKC